MSCLISLNNISFKYNLEPILERIDFSINSRERVVIAGHNGSGKSTLLNILNGKIHEFTGERSLKSGLRFETVEQFLNPDLEGLTVLSALVEKFPKEEASFREYEAEKLLEDLFFKRSEFNNLVKNLSGGGQNRLMFARAIINQPDLVFMDEPTNHLDLKSLLFIEDYIKNKANFSVVIVSHDKTFLNNVSNKTIILRDKSSYTFNLSYENALNELEKIDEISKKKLETEEKEIERIRKSAKRLAEWGRTFDNEDLSKKAKSMVKRADKLEDEKTFVSRGNPYRLDLSFDEIHSKVAVQFHNTSIFYGQNLEKDNSNLLFEVESFYINSGEKIALLGGNGLGKSTFIKTLIKNLDAGLHSKKFSFAPNLKFGLYDQEQEVLNPLMSISKEVIRISNCSDDQAKNALIHAGFSYDRHNVLIETLSGGEKSRVIFCALNLQRPNFLVLDEPTNHIDLDGRSELIQSLKDSSITALITGHDRYFIEEVADRYFLIKDGRLLEINDPNEFYEDLLSENEPEKSIKEQKSKKVTQSEDILDQILELEEKLAADLKRKSKFQKLKLQETWREKIKELYEILEKDEEI